MAARLPFGELYLWQRERRLSDADLAQLFNVSRQLIWRWNTGRTPYPLDLAARMLDADSRLPPRRFKMFERWKETNDMGKRMRRQRTFWR